MHPGVPAVRLGSSLDLGGGIPVSIPWRRNISHPLVRLTPPSPLPSAESSAQEPGRLGLGDSRRGWKGVGGLCTGKDRPRNPDGWDLGARASTLLCSDLGVQVSKPALAQTQKSRPPVPPRLDPRVRTPSPSSLRLRRPALHPPPTLSWP